MNRPSEMVADFIRVSDFYENIVQLLFYSALLVSVGGIVVFIYAITLSPSLSINYYWSATYFFIGSVIILLYNYFVIHMWGRYIKHESEKMLKELRYLRTQLEESENE